MEGFLESLVASGPLAGVLATGIYYVAKWGQQNQAESARIQVRLDACQEAAARNIERLEKEKAAEVARVQAQKDILAEKNIDILLQLSSKLSILAELEDRLNDDKE